MRLVTGRTAAGGLAVLLATSAAAPVSALDPHRSPDQYASRVWGKREGLPSSWVHAVLASRSGYLWLATGDGLVRFDGMRFTDRPLDSGGLPAGQVLALHEGRDGRLWVGTRSGLAVGDGRGSAPFQRVAGLDGSPVLSIAEDTQGIVWAASERTLWRVEGARATRLGGAQGLPGERYRVLCADPAGGLWLGTDQGLAHIEAGRATATYRARDGLGSDDVLSLAVDRDGTLWVGTVDGLVRRPRGGAFERSPAVGRRVVKALLQDRDGSVWAGTRDGLLRVHGGPPDRVGRGGGLADEHVSALAEDAEGNLWVGTEAGGLARLRNGRATAYAEAQGLTHEVVWTVLEGRDGSIWIATDGGGLNRLRDGRASPAIADPAFARENVYALFEDRAGTLWFSTGAHGLCRLAGRRARCLSEPFGNELARCLLEDRRGRLWVGTSAGLLRLDGDVARPVPAEDGRVTVTSLQEGPGDTLWVGTKSGLRQLVNGTLRRVRVGAEPHTETVTSLHADADGTLWIGTQNAGLQRLRGGRLSSVTSRQGLPDDTLLSLLEDGAGRIWMSGGRGIFSIARAELEAAADGGATQLHAVAVTEADGLRDRECSGGVQPSAWRGRDGRLWYPTIDGVAVVDPRRTRLRDEPPPVLIEELVADGRRLEPADGHELAAGTRHLEIRYAAPSFVAAERIRFEHQLEGLDTGFFAAGADRVAHYTGLGPGRYRFRVRAANEDGVWSEPAAPLTFSVRAHFWQTAWFYALAAAACLAALAAAFHLRARASRLRERELQRRVAEEMAKVDVLSGLLPICAWCKKVRDDAGYWAKIEHYISARSRLEFTHGICPDCFAEVRKREQLD